MERQSLGVKGLRKSGIKEEFRASNRPGHLQLTESDLDPGEAGSTEDTLDTVGRSNCSVKKERPVLNANPHE